MGRQQETKPTHPQRLELPDRPMGCIICALVCPQAQAYSSSNTSYPTHGDYLGCSDAYTGSLALTVRSRSLLSPRVLATEPVGVLFIGPARNQTATVSFGISVGRRRTACLREVGGQIRLLCRPSLIAVCFVSHAVP